MVSGLDVPAARALVTLRKRDAERLVEAEAELLAERRARRGRRGVAAGMARCGGCNRFVANRERPCQSCGYVPGRGWA